MASDAEESSLFINWIDKTNDEWTATWQRGQEHRGADGTHAEVLAWAARQPADHYWLFNGDEFVPWDPDTFGPDT